MIKTIYNSIERDTLLSESYLRKLTGLIRSCFIFFFVKIMPFLFFVFFNL